MKQLKTLPEDIYSLFNSDKISEGLIKKFSERLAQHISNRMTSAPQKPTLRMSNLGTKCDRKLWYSINTPELAEPLPPAAKFKFLYGDILEELILFLAEASGHKVEGQQDELDLFGVKGHRDAIIDGVVVDVKSASSFGYRKFHEGLRPETDAFGYLRQLGGYRKASEADPRVTAPGAAFVAVDKTLGHICVDYHKKDDVNYEKLVTEKRAVLSKPTPPARGYQDTEEGKSGNRKLRIECSYCDFNNTCWPGLRTFLYSTGPVHLTKVVREPNVPEAKRLPSKDVRDNPSTVQGTTE